MAIEKALLKTDKNNFYKSDFNQCYYKIDLCDVDAIKEEVRIGLRGYINKDARNQEESIGIYKKVFYIKFIELELSSFTKDEILKACYKWLSMQEEFLTGVEC